MNKSIKNPSKYYAVKNGHVPGIYISWIDCQKQINGFSGAVYKSFKFKIDAENFINGSINEKNIKIINPRKTQMKLHDEIGIVSNREEIIDSKDLYINFKGSDSKIIENSTPILIPTIILYTDGSHFKKTNGHLGCGIFCIYNNQEYKYSKVCDKDLLDTYGIITTVSNPTAEFIGYVEALKLLYNSSKDLSGYNIIFKIDYIGVSKWMSGEWQCKEDHIKKIKTQADFYKAKLSCNIIIEYVLGHSGDYGNDQADLLAKNTNNINTFDKLFKQL